MSTTACVGRSAALKTRMVRAASTLTTRPLAMVCPATKLIADVLLEPTSPGITRRWPEAAGAGTVRL